MAALLALVVAADTSDGETGGVVEVVIVVVPIACGECAGVGEAPAVGGFVSSVCFEMTTVVVF